MLRIKITISITVKVLILTILEVDRKSQKKRDAIKIYFKHNIMLIIFFKSQKNYTSEYVELTKST